MDGGMQRSVEERGHGWVCMEMLGGCWERWMGDGWVGGWMDGEVCTGMDGCVWRCWERWMGVGMDEWRGLYRDGWVRMEGWRWNMGLDNAMTLAADLRLRTVISCPRSSSPPASSGAFPQMRHSPRGTDGVHSTHGVRCCVCLFSICLTREVVASQRWVSRPHAALCVAVTSCPPQRWLHFSVRPLTNVVGYQQKDQRHRLRLRNLL